MHKERLGVEFRKLDNDAIPVRKMLAEAGYTIGENNKDLQEAKRQVFNAILLYLNSEGYPTETDPNFNEANVSDLVLYILGPFISYFKRKHVEVEQRIRLGREKQLLSIDGETGDREEFIMMEWVSVREQS